MKHLFTLAAACLISLAANADEWTMPQYSGSYQPLTPGDTVYIYNTDAHAFLTEGNDWGTHSSVGAEGLLYAVVPVEGSENTYTLSNYSITKAAWKNLFITDGGNMYVDNKNGEDFYFSFRELGDNTYNIYGADLNPTWNTLTEGLSGYLVGVYTGYTNTQTDEVTGTGVLFGAGVQDNDFLTTWAFVSKTDYAAYNEQLTAYNLAGDLKVLIDSCATLDIDATGAQVVYDNTSSTVEELNTAISGLNDAISLYYAKEELKGLIDQADYFGLDTNDATAIYESTTATKEEVDAAKEALEKAILAYQKEVVTPENPLDLTKMIVNPTFDTADGWTNSINATTFNTGTWTDASWEEGAFDGNYLNVWGSAMQGAVSQTVTGLPEGIYNIQLSVYNDNGTILLFANDNEKAIITKKGARYDVTTKVGEDGTLTLGVRAAESATIWLVIDNAKLTYYGAGLEAYRAWINSLLESAPNFDEAVVQDSLVKEYDTVLKSVDIAEDEESILAVIPAYQDILDKINANINAYATLKETITTVQTAAEESTTYYQNAVSTYITETAQPAYDNHNLGTEAVNAIIAQLTTYQTEMSEMTSYYTQLMDAETKLNEAYTASTSVEETLDKAAALISELETFDDDKVSLSDIKAMITRINDMILLLSIPAEEITDDNPVDYTAKIQDPSFSNGSSEWTNDGWGTCGYNSWSTPADGERFDANYLNLWNATGGCRVYQTLTDLPNGTYTFAIYAFADAAGLEVYAGKDDFVSVEATSGADGEGYYGHLQEVTTLVTDGTLEIGVRSTATGAVWAMVDNATLTYFGTSSQRTPTLISEVADKTATSSTIYDLTGRCINRPAQRGIYVKDGKKVVLK